MPASASASRLSRPCPPSTPWPPATSSPSRWPTSSSSWRRTARATRGRCCCCTPPRCSAPRRTRNGRHLQCRVRCDGALRSAIHFDFSAQRACPARGATTCRSSCAKNSYNGWSTAGPGQGRLVLPRLAAGDLCDALRRRCETVSPAVPSGRRSPPSRRLPRLAGWPASRGRGRRGGERGRPPWSRAAPAGGRRCRPAGPSCRPSSRCWPSPGGCCVLVADVGRRRPLLTRDAAAGRARARVAVRRRRLRPRPPGRRLRPAAAGGSSRRPSPPDMVMASAVTAAAHPQLVAAFDHVVFVDPPLDGGSRSPPCWPPAPRACVRFVWGETEVHFADTVAGDGLRHRCSAPPLVARSARCRAARSGAVEEGCSALARSSPSCRRWPPPGDVCPRPVCWLPTAARTRWSPGAARSISRSLPTYRTMAPNDSTDGYFLSAARQRSR